MTFFPILLSGNENSECKSSPITQTVYTYLSGPAFLVRFTDPNKKLPIVTSVFKCLGH